MYAGFSIAALNTGHGRTPVLLQGANRHTTRFTAMYMLPAATLPPETV